MVDVYKRQLRKHMLYLATLKKDVSMISLVMQHLKEEPAEPEALADSTLTEQISATFSEIYSEISLEAEVPEEAVVQATGR